MIKYLVLPLLLCGLNSNAEWTTTPPVKVTVWSFDKDCVQLKFPNGSMRSIPKASLNKKNLESRMTTFEVYPDSLPKGSCGK